MRKSLLLVMLMVLMMTGFSMADSLQDDSAEENSISAIPAYYPWGFTIEAAYAGPMIIQLRLFGFRDPPKKVFGDHWLSFGYSAMFLDVDLRREYISDEGLLVFVYCCLAGIASTHNWEKLLTVAEIIPYVINGNTYLSLSKNGRVGIFETHHYVDYLLSALNWSHDWEFGWSQVAGLRFVCAKEFYVDVGGHVEITNQRKLFGAFVQLGLAGLGK